MKSQLTKYAKLLRIMKHRFRVIAILSIVLFAAVIYKIYIRDKIKVHEYNTKLDTFHTPSKF